MEVLTVENTESPLPMAKKDKAPEAAGAKPEGEKDEAAPKKKLLSKKMLMIAVPALLLVPSRLIATADGQRPTARSDQP